uniref:Uncharacterized protein n=1 Tax=Arundo donax TaxID=35708 RepID=A0A0A9HC02_ARUDO
MINLAAQLEGYAMICPRDTNFLLLLSFNLSPFCPDSILLPKNPNPQIRTELHALSLSLQEINTQENTSKPT